ncbi:hypothetical protein C7S16_6919 [Burkholderia thailandensis]|uniref:Uncharacterized protein n=1 Tax=Burkholderia thailandensis TaxID=57975 RepID=A0AAW9CPJ1_BURTH|nr:hypothetical protein [Burkholderia thailandensis]MDW9252530.1 hypothetical protein [Burkholderia thailandensis]
MTTAPRRRTEADAGAPAPIAPTRPVYRHPGARSRTEEPPS